ncbi:hypothetical protein [Kerstersia gyiorum]|uniref:Uncharacterized protein n=1 Tax=Kerstersia gyiorum TaxID=206506 RepID=A0A171KSE9_9BURK|nr:hypothetical protein [Kerstersia gyiorum]KKO71816.1 hypothetical protein AAV32_09575 [Kerstersia gyiorum]
MMMDLAVAEASTGHVAQIIQADHAFGRIEPVFSLPSQSKSNVQSRLNEAYGTRSGDLAAIDAKEDTMPVDSMIGRIDSKLDQISLESRQVSERIARIESALGGKASSAQLAEAETRILRWTIATVLAVAGLLATYLK